MSRKLMGRKRGMTRFYDEMGNAVVVTVIEAEPNVITQIKTKEKDGYTAFQTGFEKIMTKDPRTVEKRVTKPRRGHFEKAGVEPRKFLRETRTESLDEIKVGDELNVAIFEKGDFIDISAVTKGKGYQGAMKKFGFGGGRATHGNSKAHRSLGSTGMRSTPGRCFPGGKRASQMGNKVRTIQNLEIIETNTDENVILVKGAIPGPRDGVVYIQSAVKKPKKQ